MLPKPKSVLIIGGGPSGLVSLRNLVERGEFEHVELVERRDDIGGVWYLDSTEGRGASTSKPKWTTPAYKGLVGNVLPEFLSFSGFPFPERVKDHPHQPFPTLTETHDYLRSFAAPFIQKGLVRLNWEATRVEEQENGAWKVSLRDWNEGAEGKECVEVWDAVVVANGWYDNPVFPETDGLDEIRSKGLAMHAKDWRGPEGFEDKRVLIIGNAASSNDIAAFLAPIAKSPVYQSIRRSAFGSFPSLPDDRIQKVAPVTKYATQETRNGGKVVEATLSDGSVIPDIDIVILGTGNRPCPAFVHVLKHIEDGDSSANRRLVPLPDPSHKPYRVPSIHRHILYAYNPTLAFIGLPMSFTPFTTTDMSSTWLSLAWSGALPYPDTVQGRLEFEKKRLETLQEWLEKTENPTSFLAYSVLASDEQGFAAGLREEVVKVRPELDEILPVWSDEKTKEREAMYPLKLEALRYAKEHRFDPQN